MLIGERAAAEGGCKRDDHNSFAGTSCLLASGLDEARGRVPFSSILQRRIDLGHTSLYALPPYSQALRAAIPGDKGFSEPKSLRCLRLQRRRRSPYGPPTVGGHDTRPYLYKAIASKDLRANYCKLVHSPSKPRRRDFAARHAVAMAVPKKFNVTAVSATFEPGSLLRSCRAVPISRPARQSARCSVSPDRAQIADPKSPCPFHRA